ncbi:MAG: hypothetical protein KatS3mg050_0196 [Litorilinea sp.]|nr:MAG: hypothetical protein KatS3mg050_0196 [Litorilinea sp.]
MAELEVVKAPHYAAAIIATLGLVETQVAAKSLIHRPPTPVGSRCCRQGARPKVLQQALRIAFQEVDLSLYSQAALTTAELRADEPGLRQLADALYTPLHVIPHHRLQQLNPEAFIANGSSA